jgi:putative hydrolase of the HAD superfamily
VSAHLPRARISCSAVLLDAGGVVVLPDRRLVAVALAQVGIEIDASTVARAHYETVHRLDRCAALGTPHAGYLHTFCSALGVPADDSSRAVGAISHLADRQASGAILWSEAAPGAHDAIAGLRRAGIAVVIVTNSDGHAAQNLGDAGICQVGSGRGATVSAIVDSELVGFAKPDPEIFRIALSRAQVTAEQAVHVGDMLSTDVAGARAAGVAPIHLDPRRSCRAADHRHLRSVGGIWRHVAASG